MGIVGSIDLYSQFEKYMEQYTEEIDEQLRKDATKVANKGKELIKDMTPVRTRLIKRGKGGNFGHYVDSYVVKRSKKDLKTDVVLWNKQYQLSHLLERNHAWANQWGTRRGYTTKNTREFWYETEQFMTDKFYEDAKNSIEKINMKRSK